MTYFLFYVFSCIISLGGRRVTGLVPDMTPFKKEMTLDLFVSFNNETKDYKPTSVESIMNDTRRQFYYDWFWASHVGGKDVKILACYMTTVTYKTALWNLRHYFGIRTLYLNTLEYEVGYLTHEIIYRYQLILELYHMVEKRFTNLEHKNLAPLNYMLYIYTNILLHSRVIIHLCNMMHELESKYVREKKGVFDDYGSASKSYARQNKTILDVEEQFKLYLERKRKEEKKKRKEMKQYHKEMQKYGSTTTRKWKSPKKGISVERFLHISATQRLFYEQSFALFL